jgi:formylmethanofuran dehydrogenase subunit E
MGTTALKCSKCGKFRISKKRNFMEGFVIDKNKPICKDCYKKERKK